MLHTTCEYQSPTLNRSVIGPFIMKCQHDISVSYTTGSLAGRVVLRAVLYQGSGQLSSTSLQEWGVMEYLACSDSVPLYTPLQWIR